MLKYIFSFLPFMVQSLVAQNNYTGAVSGNATYSHFTPVTFSNLFSLNREPALRIRSGDTVSTETIDAMGHDKNGVKRQKGGNPLTGPFYVENCLAGDILQVALLDISLNRTSAYTTEAFVSRSVPDSISSQFKKPHLVKWKLDIENLLGWPDSSFNPYNQLKHFKVPLKPFLGCIGVAPLNGKNEILSFFQGDFGGNLDYSSISTSSIVYLPVLHDGAYLYLGDGHAVQGDGEIAGNALETSLNLVFTVRVIKSGRQLTNPRVEDSSYIMSLGIADKLDKALKMATADLLVWIQKDYQLSIGEATQVLSTGIQYRIAEIADPQVIVVANLKKGLLKSLH